VGRWGWGIGEVSELNSISVAKIFGGKLIFALFNDNRATL
jgi:hypothetical protein